MVMTHCSEYYAELVLCFSFFLENEVSAFLAVVMMIDLVSIFHNCQRMLTNIKIETNPNAFLLQNHHQHLYFNSGQQGFGISKALFDRDLPSGNRRDPSWRYFGHACLMVQCSEPSQLYLVVLGEPWGCWMGSNLGSHRCKVLEFPLWYILLISHIIPFKKGFYLSIFYF